MSYKTGRFTKEEQDYIKLNCEKRTPSEIGRTINRNPDSIRSFMQKKGLLVRGSEDHKEYAEHNLLSSDHWDVLKERYTNKEQQLFTMHYKEIVGQFQNEVPYTENLQIIDYIHVEIEIQRVSVQMQNMVQSIHRLESKMDKLYKIDEEKGLEAEQLIIQKETSTVALRKQLGELLDKKEKYAKALKGTREQRIKRVEESKKTFSGFVADLLSNPEKMRKVGYEIENHRLATEVEYVRLQDLHVYADGEVDPPILNVDSAKNIKKIDEDLQNQDLEEEKVGNDESENHEQN